MSGGFEFALQVLIGAHHPVDLRLPGVGGD